MSENNANVKLPNLIKALAFVISKYCVNFTTIIIYYTTIFTIFIILVLKGPYFWITAHLMFDIDYFIIF